MKKEAQRRKRFSADEKRSNILDAALQLFAEHGFHATNVPLIAERSGVSVGTIYHYFASKEALANELYRQIRREMEEAVYLNLPAGVAPFDQFRALWQRFIAYALANPLAFRFLELHYHEPYLDEASTKLDQQVVQRTHEMMERGRHASVLKPVKDEVLLAFIDGAIKHLLQAAQAGRVALTDEVIDQAAACCWQAIQEGWPIMDKFTLAGETGRVSLSCEYAQRSESDSDLRGTVSIASWGFQAQGKVWFRAADLVSFHTALHACYQALSGTATFATHDENLKLEVVFGQRGWVDVRGTFRDTHHDGNELTFRIQSDQSFIAQSLTELAELVARL